MKPYIVAHRGSSRQRHENTLEAFDLAVEQGADYVEFDVRRSVDGVLIIHHDEKVGGYDINSSNYEELVTASSRIGYAIPTLKDVVSHLAGKIKFDVELKEEGYEIEVMEILLANCSTNSFVVTTFNESSIERIKNKYANQIRCGLLLGQGGVRGLRYPVARLKEIFPMGRARRIRTNFLAINFHLLKSGIHWRSLRAGLPLWVWTVDDRDFMRKLSGMKGIEAIITNVPDAAVAEQRKIQQIK